MVHISPDHFRRPEDVGMLLGYIYVYIYIYIYIYYLLYDMKALFLSNGLVLMRFRYSILKLTI